MDRSKPLAAVLLLAGMFLASRALIAQEPQTVRVPEGNGKPILTDGIFSPGEWDDALKIPIRPNVELLLKKSAGFVFVGIRYIPFTLSVVDLFISPDGKAIRHLHVSAQLGERLLNDTPGTDDDPEFIWGDTTGWYANEIRWNERKVQAMIKEGKDSGQAQEASLYKYDGFEFQIRQSKFGPDEWLVRVETPLAPDWEKPVVFPEGTDTVSTRGWLKLVFK
ncbi:MAG TPA: hypothetical protein VMY15_01910 [Candidatus Latescibacteria bacterium]|nr:hypothetical protein [Candidatus Latescibacterota bacterium]